MTAKWIDPTATAQLLTADSWPVMVRNDATRRWVKFETAEELQASTLDTPNIPNIILTEAGFTKVDTTLDKWVDPTVYRVLSESPAESWPKSLYCEATGQWVEFATPADMLAVTQPAAK